MIDMKKVTRTKSRAQTDHVGNKSESQNETINSEKHDPEIHTNKLRHTYKDKAGESHTRHEADAPPPWPPCRPRHPAAHARSPRDLYQRHESAPCIRPARACESVCVGATRMSMPPPPPTAHTFSSATNRQRQSQRDTQRDTHAHTSGHGSRFIHSQTKTK